MRALAECTAGSGGVGRALRASCLCLCLALAASCDRAHGEESHSIQVAAASDLTYAFTEMGALFEARTGVKVSFTFGSTAELARELVRKKPVDMLVAPNVPLADYVTSAGACDASTRQLYARGRLVLWAPTGGVLGATSTIRDLARPEIVRVAISDPEHSAHGTASRQALESGGVWAEVATKLVPAPNVRRALELARSHEVDVAITSLSLARAQPDGVVVELDEAAYAPLNQALVLCTNGRNLDGARRWSAFLTSAEGRAIMARYGYLAPAP
jgi:molybdate transport system substrate-binding protein